MLLILKLINDILWKLTANLLDKGRSCTRKEGNLKNHKVLRKNSNKNNPKIITRRNMNAVSKPFLKLSSNRRYKRKLKRINKRK